MEAPYRSPKRKRDASEFECYSPSASPPSSGSAYSLQDSRLREDSTRACSPRTTVARSLKKLDIHGENISILENDPNMGDNEELHWADGEAEPAGRADTLAAPGKASNSERDEERLGRDKQQDKKAPVIHTHSRKTELTANPCRKRDSLLLSRPRSQRKSPPLSGNENEDPLTWHDSEITGYCPTDPSDDGYGINGIGFKPTAAVAWARSQKRQKQVAEWKYREEREAREKRRERREGINRDKARGVREGSVQKKVKFNIDN